MAGGVMTVDLGHGYVAKVNLCTFERLKLGRFQWVPQVHKRAGKVYAQSVKPSYAMHRWITNAKPGQIVDHINGDGLDNRDENLRVVTGGQNRANSKRNRDNKSGYKGVTWERTSHKWSAKIVHHGVRYYLGVYQDKRRAALAHDRAALAIHGEHAGLNFPDRKDKIRPTMPEPSRTRQER